MSKITKLYKIMKVVFKPCCKEYDAPRLFMVNVRAERGFAGSDEMYSMLDDLYETNGTWD